ncbi:uncharacterized protein F4807DRAFT_29618 [Annulohypoxylon truncatum]|uniref:uncharacterized protein n=1 Tax=Annulohypoxylon truncatum TaxID=327061 RepID=UPI00200887AB|nr:uncharacterized protein F4807DRAFT_29618 [Annulohypoxylon truncatum]KAI1211251.1 hypothetical protein F4807DRAFT_29618 [Annulohypoxylon truncatum]
MDIVVPYAFGAAGTTHRASRTGSSPYFPSAAPINYERKETVSDTTIQRYNINVLSINIKVHIGTYIHIYKLPRSRQQAGTSFKSNTDYSIDHNVSNNFSIFIHIRIHIHIRVQVQPALLILRLQRCYILLHTTYYILHTAYILHTQYFITDHTPYTHFFQF